MIHCLLTNPHITKANKILVPNNDKDVQTKKLHTSRDVLNNDNFNSIKKAPANITFSGLSCTKNLENLKIIETLEDLTEVEHYPLRKVFEAARKFVAPAGTDTLKGKKLHKATSELIDKAIDSVLSPEKPIDETVQKFMADESNAKAVKTFIEDAKMTIKHSDGDMVTINHDSEGYKNFVKSTTGKAVKVLNSIDKPGQIYTGKFSKTMFEAAEKNQLVFQAAFSALLACFLRPATIISLPGKKNKEDKIYASAHSVSSGCIGYIEAFAIATPIATAVTLIAKNPLKYIKEETLKFLEGKKPAEVIAKKGRRIAENATELIDAKKFGIAKKYMGMIPGVLTAVPQAMLTVALIPFVLKHIFGLEKKHHGAPAKPAQAAPAVQNPTPAPTAAVQVSNGPAVKGVSESAKKVFKNFMGESK